MGRMVDFIKARSEAAFFAVAALIFVVGVTTFVASRRGDDGNTRVRRSPSPGTARVGPSPGEAIPAYVQKKRGELEAAAGQRPDETRFAVASFAEYRKPKDVDQFLEARRTSALTVQWRVPRPDFQPAEVGISSDVASALSPELKKVIDSRKDELEGLEGYINSTQDAASIAVFREDADRARETIGFLESDPPLVYAFVLRGKNSALASLLKVPELRLVDISADAAATPSTTEFSGLLPEAVEKA